MQQLPTGTLTLLFSDIEGSTSLLNRLGSDWGQALSAQRRILRDAFADHGGTEVGTEGDSFFVVFASAQEAVLSAIDAQRGLMDYAWPHAAPVRVRMGLHTGEPQRHEDGYIGIDIHRAARIAATAHGGQIVISEATQALIATQFRAELRDLGWHRLKDLPTPEHLFDVLGEGLLADHPPLRSLGTRANLPSYASELVGRTADVAHLCEEILTGRSRLITLTGTGGTGKTRLAVAVATELQNRLSCETYFVPLHTADRAPLMWAAIAEAVSAPAETDQPLRERTLRFLADRAAFLILDNLEQVEQADAAVSELLAGATGVIVLATSRRPLHLAAERQYPVPPLDVPAQESFRAPQDALHGAVDLFVRRARMVKPSFTLTADNVDDVVGLCRRLDGLPLAIELAAARMRLLSTKALLKRINTFGATETAGADRVERQRTLAATIAWSYDLLEHPDQQAFDSLGVFSSRFDLDALAEIVELQDRDPLDVVEHFVDVSLMEIVEGPDGEPMLWLLETIRRFARDRLQESGRESEVRLRHGSWCLQAASQISDLLGGAMQMSALDRMHAVEEDIRAALDWCLKADGPARSERLELGFSLLIPMIPYWDRFVYAEEGRAWCDRALQALGSGSTVDSTKIVDALHGQGILALVQNDLPSASRALEQALEMAQRLSDDDRQARESNSLGLVRREAGDIEAARKLIESSLQLARRGGDREREATALTNMLPLHMDTGDYAAAVEAARQAITADEAMDNRWGVAINQANLVLALLHAQGPQAAYAQLVATASDAVALGDVELNVNVIEYFACVWAALGNPDRAAQLLGSADAHRERAGIPRTGPDQAHVDRFLEPARQERLPQEWDEAYLRGRSLGVQDAVQLGLRPADPDAGPT